jgi:hypothetical protein
VLSYEVKFNKLEKERKGKDGDGPVVDRKCPKCSHKKMSYATVQLRYVLNICILLGTDTGGYRYQTNDLVLLF